MKKLFKLSKWIHKYIGLLLVLFLMWESASGILMNHPELISNISVPGWLIPSHYHIENWNRSSLTRIVYSNTNKERLFGSGKLGVWESNDGGKTFYPFMKGYTESYYYLKTNDLFLHENDSLQILFAAADDGLYYNSFIDNVCDDVCLLPGGRHVHGGHRHHWLLLPLVLRRVRVCRARIDQIRPTLPG